MSESEMCFTDAYAILSVGDSMKEGEVMDLDHDACYSAIKAKDARFDGVFYTAVKSTGIYCRPVCKVPTPKSVNCTFYKSAAQAEVNGYRPCLRCRPELAPNYSEFGQGKELFKAILNYFEAHNYEPGIVKECANDLGINPRHLNRVFHTEAGVSPKEYIMTKRLLRAKALLTDTHLSITEIALMVGFGSVSRFNAALKKRYKLTPSEIRKEYKSKMNQDAVTVRLFYRPPYDWDYMLKFFKLRAVPGIERVTDKGVYQRSLSISANGKSYTGWIEVKPVAKQHRVDVRIGSGLENAVVQVIALVRKVFDLDAVPERLPKDLPDGLRLPGCFNIFEMSVRAILGQQITVKAATTIAGRLVRELGQEVTTPWEEINLVFPEATRIIGLGENVYEVLGNLGVIHSKTESILSLANGIHRGDITFTEKVEVFRQKLLALKGIGPWTAAYLSMRGLSWPDAFPVTDVAIKKGLVSFLTDEKGVKLIKRRDLSPYKINKLYEKRAIDFSKKYQPWRSYLTLALWRGEELRIKMEVKK